MEWISVEDKLPEEYKTVLCYTRSGYQVSCDLVDGDWFDPGYRVRDVTHWMPLPEAPK